MSRASKKVAEAKRKFADMIASYVKKHKVGESDLEIFRYLTGWGNLTNSMLASDLTLRNQAGKILAETLWSFKCANPGVTFHFWTFVHDKGNTSDRTPAIELKAIQSLVDKVFRRYGIDGIQVFEIQGLGNHPQKGEGRTIMNHVHAVSWSLQSFDHLSVMREINASPVWQNSLGAAPVRIKPILDTWGDLHYVVEYYLFKPPHDVKMLEDRKGGSRLKGTERGYRPEFAVRILEGLSQLEIAGIIRATSGGTAIRKECIRRLRYWHKSRAKWSGAHRAPDLAEFWGRYRMKRRKCDYMPYVINR
jgi:hypothetical protein